MAIENYTDLFPSRIWKRGIEYFYDSRVLFEDEVDGYLRFIAEGNQGNYTVVLSQNILSTRGFRFSCTCPYSGPCKHIAAAIMEGLEEGILHDEEEEEEVILDPVEILNRFQEQNTLIDLDKKPRTREIPFPIMRSREITQQHSKLKLFFKIQWKNFSHYFDKTTGFYLIPCSQYIKKDGSLGAVKELTRFSSELRCSPEEEELHRLIHSMPEGKNRLLTLLPDLEDLPEGDLRIHSTRGLDTLEMKELESLHIKWTVVLRGDEIFYQSVIRFNGSGFVHSQSIFFEQDFRTGLFQDKDKSVLYRLNSRASHFSLLNELISDKRFYSREETDRFLQMSLPSFLSMERQGGKIELKKILPRPRVLLKEHYKELEVRFLFLYGDCEVSSGSPQETVQGPPDEENSIIYQRETETEQAMIFHILAIKEGYSQIPDPFRINLSLEEFFESCSTRIYQWNGEILLKEGKKKISKAPVQFQLRSGIDWLETRLNVEGEKMEIPSYIPSSGLVPYSGGYKILTQEEREKLTGLLNRGKRTGEFIRTSKRDLSTISLLEEEIEQLDDSGLKHWLEVLKELRKGFQSFSISQPAGLKAKLRPYQKQGLRWLRFLYTYRLGGTLADDMGLGKTVQSIALLLHALKEGAEKPFLVAAPVSTLKNWEREIQRFAPSLKTHLHQGSGREPWTTAPGLVVLTSYHTMIRDEKLFHKEQWDLVMLDESQALKNSTSRSYKTVKALETEQYLALSGTPVENHIGELWSLMNLLNPGLLGDLKGFLARYRKPLQNGNRMMMEDLKTRIHPFILRRRKEEVALDLPAREEILLTLPLSPREQQFYDHQKRAYIKEISRLKASKAKAFELSAALLQALNSLRQCAISPVLRNGPDISSKLDLAMEKIIEAREENHKLLVFSQYTRVIDLMEPRLDKKNIPWLRLDGSMTAKKREKAVKTFQNDPEKGVFLISIKAGGTGINLVEADYVIILDPWWNPAVENQAIDRSHRIGQTKKVTAYKIIAEQTVEEKVLALQKQKTDLVEGLLSGSSSPLGKMNAEDIINLF